MSKLYIGIDLGGTKIAAGIVDEKGNIIAKSSIKTSLPQSPEVIENKIYDLAVQLCKANNINIHDDITAIGIGSPGSVNSKLGIVAFNANFGYKNWQLKRNMEKLFFMPIFIENDANTAIVAEVTAGNAKGCHDAIIITLGTGIGSGIVINDKVFSGSNNAGAEIGHTSLIFNGRQCNCGRKGCFEKYASATALVSDTKKAMQENSSSKLWEIAGDLDKVNAKTAFDAMRAGDKIASEVIDQYIQYLACGLVNIINVFQPEIICLGGGISNEKEYLIGPIMDIIDKEEYARNMDKRVKITTAMFRNDAGIIGAALLGVNNG